MEDGIVLARSFAEASKNGEVEEEFKKNRNGTEKICPREETEQLRALRSTSYVVGSLHQSDRKIVNFL